MKLNKGEIVLNNKKLALIAVAGSALVSGCAIHQTVQPVDQFSGRQICIVENGAVKNGFMDALRGSLSSKGYEVRVVPASSSLNECPIMATYDAHWRWDLAMYMAYAEIKVYNHAKPSGQAIYDSTRGGANMGKFISAEKKVAELVNQLFPGGANS